MSQSRKVQTRDGTTLHCEVWEPEGSPRFVVCLVHGQGEHVSRYDQVAAELNAIGALVFGADHRGEGRSGGRPGHVEGFEHYARDLLDLLEDQRGVLGESCDPETVPWFIWAHSMGGLVTLTYLLDHQKALPLRGVVISAPLLGLKMKVGAFKEFLVRAIARLLPTLAVPTGIDSSAISRDEAQVQRYANDPRRTTKITTRWAVSMEQAIARVDLEIEAINTPMHWYVGTGDLICDHEDTTRIFTRLSAASQNDQTIQVWPGYYHELHNEPETLRAPVIAAVHAWIDERL